MGTWGLSPSPRQRGLFEASWDDSPPCPGNALGGCGGLWRGKTLCAQVVGTLVEAFPPIAGADGCHVFLARDGVGPQVRVSCYFIELYLDNLRDLFFAMDNPNKGPPKLDIKLDEHKMVVLKNVVTKAREQAPASSRCREFHRRV